MTFESWTFPMATFLLGQLSLILMEWFRIRQVRNQRRGDARDDFQRQTLHELQDTLDELARDAAMVIVLWEHGLQLPGQPSNDRDDNSHAQDLLQAILRLPTLAGRVQDQAVRRLVGQLDVTLREAIQVGRANDTAEAMSRVQDLRQQANERIGTLLRSH